ncbi:MAG TPA: hypothetical protein ENI33_05070 [Thermoplasmatales archaeon]|nr:hypothetical protein [Thermoplasmatales archaeon]
MKKTFIISVSLLILISVFVNINVYAHPPENMKLKYDFLNQTLYVRIEHRVSNPLNHYIETVIVEVKEQEYVFNYDSQPTTSIFTYNYTISADCGDLINVTAYCNIEGSIKRTIIACYNAPPIVKIIYPEEGQEVNNTVRIEGISYDADMDDVVYEVEISFDGSGVWHLAKGTNNWYYNWSTTNFSNGVHRIYARAYDGKNYSQLASINVTVNNPEDDTTPPSINIEKPREGYLYISDREIMPIGTTIIIGKITVKANARDAESGMKKVEFYIDDELRYTDVEAPYEWEWKEISFGIHEIKAMAYDKKDNSSDESITVFKML